MVIKKPYMHNVRIFVCSFFIHFILTGYLSAQYKTDVIKAAYIERITRFIEWPPVISARDPTVFVIGVYEDPEFYKTLIEMFRVKTIKDRKVKILKITDHDQIKFCDICYISEKGKPDIKRFVALANENGVLLISDSRDFGLAGIHINFFVEDDKLKFEINKASIDSGKLKVSSLLMKSSKVI